MRERLLWFLYRFVRPAADYAMEREQVFEVEGESRSATVYLPRSEHGPVPAWILLQGVTVPGRHHQGVRRMARALAAAGQLVFVPEVPAWTELRVDPTVAEPTVRSALACLATNPRVDGRRVGLMGFSVAATWALEVAAGDLRDDFRVVVSFGGYGDLRRTVRAMLVGEHEWRGKRYRYTPDPYGRWIVGANLLPLLEDERYGARQERETAARGLHRLAYTAGRNGAPARESVFDPLIRQLRQSLPPATLPAWDLLAPTSERLVPDPEAGRALADALAHGGMRSCPPLDPSGRLDGLAAPTILVHGRVDTLIPFSESFRLAAQLPRRVRSRVTITSLFGHAKRQEAQVPRNPLALGWQVWRFVRTMDSILESVGP